MSKEKSRISETDRDSQKDVLSPRFVRQRLQNFLIIWLDDDLDESKEDVKRSIEQMRRIVLSVTTFTNKNECIDFLSETVEEKVFLIISHSLGQELISHIQIHTWQQVEYIYIFSNHTLNEATWPDNIPKLKGIYSHIDSICQNLKIDCHITDRATIPVTFNGIDPLFMYTQFLKEAFLEIEDDDNKSISDFAEYCCLQDVSKSIIKKFEQEYSEHSPIWWYTGPFFIYSMLNRGLRQMDVDIILKMGFFIRHLHNHIQQMYAEKQSTTEQIATSFTVYRGQGLSLENFDKMRRTEGDLMSFNNFLSTTFDRQIALGYAQPGAFHVEPVGILFVININPKTCQQSNIPFAHVQNTGFFGTQEEEILFTTHTIYRIHKIQHLEHSYAKNVYEVNLTLVGNEDHQLNPLITHLRNEFNTEEGWSRLGTILLKIGEPNKAESVFNTLLEKANTEETRANYYRELAFIYHNTGDYQRASVCLEEAFNYKKRALPPNHPALAISYNNIGSLYPQLGEHSKALSSYEQTLEILKITLPPNHPLLASSYNNIGSMYDDMGEYSKALSSYERSLEIRKIALPANHPLQASSYNNIGGVYSHMGEYSKALSSYERCLEIHKIALPANHPDLASSYNNIGDVYSHMAEYSKALSSYEQCFEIRKIALPPNHPDLASSYNNIGSVYYHMGEYSKAISSYKRCLEIHEIALPPNHPLLAISYNNIGSAYDDMGEYSKALSSYERCLEIRKIALPANHPLQASCYNNIGSMYYHMGEYSKALSSFERSLEIRETALPPNHPDLAASYNNIGSVYSHMGEYSKALSSHERALEIRKKALPANHPDLASSYNNIGGVYDDMKEYSKALSSYERSLEIHEIALPPNHPLLASSYNNIGSVYSHMGEYSKALSLYERSLEIRETALPPNHPLQASSYNNIGDVYSHMGEYSKALSSYERSLEIRKIALPANHPLQASSYKNIGNVYCDMDEYAKALLYYEKAYDIFKESLPPTHPIMLFVERKISSTKEKII